MSRVWRNKCKHLRNSLHFEVFIHHVIWPRPKVWSNPSLPQCFLSGHVPKRCNITRANLANYVFGQWPKTVLQNVSAWRGKWHATKSQLVQSAHPAGPKLFLVYCRCIAACGPLSPPVKTSCGLGQQPKGQQGYAPFSQCGEIVEDNTAMKRKLDKYYPLLKWNVAVLLFF